MKIFRLLIVLFVLNSCRQSVEIKGTVQNFNSNQALAKVHIFQKDDPQNDTYTDSSGNFRIKNGSFEFWGPSLTVVVEKQNYQSKLVAFDHCESEYILLKPLK